MDGKKVIFPLVILVLLTASFLLLYFLASMYDVEKSGHATTLQKYNGQYDNIQNLGRDASPRNSMCNNLKLRLIRAPGWYLIGPSDGKVLSVEYFKDKELYVTTSSGGVFRSLDNGKTWVHFSEGLTSRYVESLEECPKF